MDKNKKLKKTKDSILIRKNGKYSENAGEIARQRAIYMLFFECGILITYVIFLILFIVQDRFKMLYQILQLVIVTNFIEIQDFTSNCFELFLNTFNDIFQRIYHYQKFQLVLNIRQSCRSILLYCLMIVPFVLMCLEDDKFTIQVILQIILLSCCIILCSLDQYLIRIFVIDFLKEKQRYNLKAALHNRKSFEDQLQQSIMNRSEDFT
ncbi:unnamed protein product [Paramecium sonneborni]|uniref:Transmembrane protein n=1 Tax=Paramecium sonneborni TaxID=65129 RepID=A0A8S1RHF6_9CILI|nr:unnamed protein product [Paramecium sonneborni]